MSYRVDGSIMVLLGLATILWRLPSRSRNLNAWDSTSFALALEDFDVYAHRPHAPGYPVYIAAVRLIHTLVPEANEALVLASILFSALAVVFLYGLVREVGSIRAALGAAVLFIVAPVFVFNGLIALSYTAEAAASTGLAWLAWRTRRDPSRSNVIGLSAAWALAVGLRQSLFIFLTPLVAYALLGPRKGRDPMPKRLLIASGSGVAGAVIWFIPMISATTNGFEGWRQAMQIQGGLVVFTESVFTRGWPAWQEHSARVAFFLHAEISWLLVPVLAALLVLVLLQRTSKRTPDHSRSPSGPATFAAAWLLPSLLFYLLVFSGWDRGPTGYILVLLPGLYAIYGWVLDRAIHSIEIGLPAGWAKPAAAVLAVPLLLFPWPGLHEDGTPFLEQEIRAHDEWADRWRGLRESYPPSSTAILAYYSWAHVKWYFPEYLVWGYFPVPRDEDPPEWELFLETRNHQDDVPFYEAHARGPGQAEHQVPPEIDTIIVFDFQLAGENGGPRRLRDEVNITEDFLPDGWRLLRFGPDPGHPTIESYFSRADA